MVVVTKVHGEQEGMSVKSSSGLPKNLTYLHFLLEPIPSGLVPPSC